MGEAELPAHDVRAAGAIDEARDLEASFDPAAARPKGLWRRLLDRLRVRTVTDDS